MTKELKTEEGISLAYITSREMREKNVKSIRNLEIDVEGRKRRVVMLRCEIRNRRLITDFSNGLSNGEMERSYAESEIQKMRSSSNSEFADKTDDELEEFLEGAENDLNRLILLLDGFYREIKSKFETGEKFTNGRKEGATGPIRKKIAALLKKEPGMKNEDLWQAIAARPPRGWVSYDNGLGQYFDGPCNKNMGRDRFNNIASEERRKLKNA